MINNKCIDCNKLISSCSKRCKSCANRKRIILNMKRPKGIKYKNNGLKKNENNPNWKGDRVKYLALHQWIRRHKIKPELCERCNKDKPYDLANMSGKYKRDINDFEWLCRKCHMVEDNRLNLLKKFNFKRIKLTKEIAKRKYFIEGKSVTEICKEFNIHPSNVYTKLNLNSNKGRHKTEVN